MNATRPAVFLIASIAWIACDQGKSVRKPGEDPRAENTVSGGEKTTPDDVPAAVDLDDVPAIDLLANRNRWHFYSDGLVIGFADDGLHKYSRAYKRPFGDVIKTSGGPARSVTRGSFELLFPWDGATDASKLHVWADAGKGSFRLNGKSLSSATPGADGASVVDIPDGLLRAGENKLEGKVGKSPVRAITIGAKAEPTAPGVFVASATLGGKSRASMGGFDRARIWVEVPRDSFLDFAVGAEGEGATYRITAQTFDADAREIAAGTAPAGSWQQQTIALDDFANKLIALDVWTKGGAHIGEPRIALRASKKSHAVPPYKNAILLVVDALRSDRLSLYADTRVRTPRIEAEAKRGVVFRNNQAASPSSPPSHGSIQTGMIPRVHGVASDKAKLHPGTPMISTVAGAAGLRTAYYGNNPFGMARLKTPGKWTEFHQPNSEGKGMDCAAIIDGILDFATRSNKSGKRFFISSLPYEPHTPYRYHEGITNRFYDGAWSKRVGKRVDGHLTGAIADGRTKVSDDEWQQILALYDGEVEHWDACFGELMDGLEERGLTKDTVVILTSDHGEGMMEHGKMGHAYGHYFELANVPLVIYGDGLVSEGPRNIETVTNHTDIAPTVLALLGVDPPAQMQGESLIPMMQRADAWTPRVTSLEYGRSYALRSQRFKYIVQYNGTASLYDHATDPTEQTDIIEDRPFVLRYFRELEGFFLTHRSDWRAATWGTLGNHAAGFGATPND